MPGTTITPPTTYAEWVKVLDMLERKENDEAVVEAMKTGTLEFQSGVAERFMKKLIDVMNHRMNTANDKFQTELNRSRGEERAIVQALLTMRKELAFIYNAIDLPVIPEEYRKQYVQMVKDRADEIQKALEDSSKNDRTGKMERMVRNNKVNAF